MVRPQCHSGVVLALAWAAIASCAAPQDPCPPGSIAVENQDRCVQRGASLLPDSSVDADIGNVGDAAQDAATTQQSDAALDPEAGEPDAGKLDAGDTLDSGGLPVCSRADVQAWKSFHEQEGLVTQLNECALMGCVDQSCPAQACVRARAGVAECSSCTEAEGECVRVSCFLACGSNGDDRECRACECEAACIGRFEACAQAELGLCEGPVYGRDLTPEQLTVTDPLVLRLKPDNGALQPVPIAEDLSLGKFLSTDHLSTGFGLMVSFSRGERSYVIQHKNNCADTPCIARISPISTEGVLGRPVYSESWTSGWDRLTTFLLGTEIYLVRYKTGGIPAETEPKGHLRIERMVFDAASEHVALEPMLDEQATPVFESAWSALETFAIGSTPYLASYGSDRAGELTFWKLAAAKGEVTRTAASTGLRFPRGYDVFGAFQHANRWYITAYASGRANANEVESGRAVIVEPVLASPNVVTLREPSFDGNLGAGLTHLIAFHKQARLGILRFSAGSGNASVVALPSDSAAWASQTWTTTYSGNWSTSPQWTLVEIVDPNAWGITMMRRFLLLSSLSLLVACARDYDPCPPGSTKSTEADRCVVTGGAQNDAETPAPDAYTPDGSQELPDASISPGERDASMDASLTVEAGVDASTGPAPGPEAGVDASVSLDASAPPDAGTTDAEAPLEAGAADAGQDGSVPPACSADDVDAWRALHLSDQLTSSIGACLTADPGCLSGSCPLDVCLRQKAGVAACETCVQDETECVASQCRGPCGPSGSDAECRACACAKGCVGAFDSCAGTALDVCADCNGTTCMNMSVLKPELIMVVLHPILSGMLP